MIGAFVLFLTICGPASAPCEDGFLLHRSCAEAERFIRAGLRPGQRLFITGCESRAQ